ncbi:hypothetical protein CEXT_284991 [Caerostris extrusa]|uniref:Uncharacterized protein n=1 Tax=Caerostris extrusa TaxID=172846 RepID=A0AAV4XDF5_CAEEX|nr:hypothetical protein CEXT_284991 [Caerostris extrusa]
MDTWRKIGNPPPKRGRGKTFKRAWRLSKSYSLTSILLVNKARKLPRTQLDYNATLLSTRISVYILKKASLGNRVMNP